MELDITPGMYHAFQQHWFLPETVIVQQKCADFIRRVLAHLPAVAPGGIVVTPVPSRAAAATAAAAASAGETTPTAPATAAAEAASSQAEAVLDGSVVRGTGDMMTAWRPKEDESAAGVAEAAAILAGLPPVETVDPPLSAGETTTTTATPAAAPEAAVTGEESGLLESGARPILTPPHELHLALQADE